MATIEIKGIDELVSGIGELGLNQVPFALAKSLTELAYIAKDNTVKRMTEVFNNPTPFTLNSLKVVGAKKGKLTALVNLKDPTKIDTPTHYLNPQLDGGDRHHKAYEGRLYYAGIIPQGYFTVPVSKADMDPFGNLNSSKIIQMLTYFQAYPEAGFKSNMTTKGIAKLGKTTKKKYGISYFAIHPGDGGKLSPGIYQAIDSNFGRAVKMILMYVKYTHYKQRLDIQNVASATYEESFAGIFHKNFIDAVNTALK